MDRIENWSQYKNISEGIAVALEYLKNTNFKNKTDGKHELHGKEMFALINSYTTVDPGKAKWESHKKYIDVHYIIEGTEEVGISSPDKLKIIEEYNDEKDCIKYSGNGNIFTASAGDFFIFFPEDSHKPGIHTSAPSFVKKAVVKVKVD